MNPVNNVEAIIELLTDGTLLSKGRIAWGSNYTMLAQITLDNHPEQMVVYKPKRGEQPLWDFPVGTLCYRERAAWLICDALGWKVVPPTILREAMYGVGSVQLFIEHDPNKHYFDIQGDTRYQEQLQQIALLDLVINNADRKGGHVLLGENGTLWAIDHGVSFHVESKLRTVIWEFKGQEIAEHHLFALTKLRDKLLQLPSDNELFTLLATDEIRAIQNRLTELLTVGMFPEPGKRRHYPWPPI